MSSPDNLETRGSGHYVIEGGVGANNWLDRIPWGSRFVRRVLDQFGSRKFSDTAWRTSFGVGLLSVVSGGNAVLTVVASASALMAVASSIAEDAHHGKQPL